MVSIICPTYNEEKYIYKCIQSVLEFDYPKEQMEIIFIDGLSTDNTREIISSYCKIFSFIKLLDNVNKTVPYALNIGVENAKGEYIIRIDAHSIYPKSYVKDLIYWAKKLDADNVGGICQTRAINPNSISLSIAKVMSDKFGVGNSDFRTGVSKITEVDTVPFGCFRKDVFARNGLFDIRLTRNQDIEFNKRLKRNGGKIYLIPSINCIYIPRDNYRDFAKNRYLTGLWIINTSFFTNTFSNLSIRHFVPLLFIISLTVSLIGTLIYPFFFFLFLLIILLYTILMLGRSICINSRETTFYTILVSFYVLHFSYGYGSLVGICMNLSRLIKK